MPWGGSGSEEALHALRQQPAVMHTHRTGADRGAVDTTRDDAGDIENAALPIHNSVCRVARRRRRLADRQPASRQISQDEVGEGFSDIDSQCNHRHLLKDISNIDPYGSIWQVET
jgi:hypothetical protein